MTDAEKIQKAIVMIESFGDTDGAHHKQWLIDQLLRLLLGSEERYVRWRGNRTIDDYGWDEGVAP